MSITVHLASDHAGFDMKQELLNWLRDHDYGVVDHGAHEYDPDDDYNEFILDAVKATVDDANTSRAIIFGGSGQGEAMMANRIKGARASVYTYPNLDIIKLSREHNDANILSIAARFISNEDMIEAVELWLTTTFPAEDRHVRRNTKLDSLLYE
jgi:ribose 5-phosphate isomerase B